MDVVQHADERKWLHDKIYPHREAHRGSAPAREFTCKMMTPRVFNKAVFLFLYQCKFHVTTSTCTAQNQHAVFTNSSCCTWAQQPRDKHFLTNRTIFSAVSLCYVLFCFHTGAVAALFALFALFHTNYVQQQTSPMFSCALAFCPRKNSDHEHPNTHKENRLGVSRTQRDCCCHQTDLKLTAKTSQKLAHKIHQLCPR